MDRLDAVAVVAGMTINGLAVARALGRSGIPVYAIIENENAPENKTRFAKMYACQDHSHVSMSDKLVCLSQQVGVCKKKVLFVTSDNSLRDVILSWDLLEKHGYVAAWKGCLKVVDRMITKSGISEFCIDNHITHPATYLVSNVDEIDDAFAHVNFPCIVKPDIPQGMFKAKLIRRPNDNIGDIFDALNVHPLVVQEYVGAAHDPLFFCIMYVEKGAVKAGLTGLKLLSEPPGTGVGLIMSVDDNDEVAALGGMFVYNLDYTGMIALEFKRNPGGDYILIEANIARSEYCIDLAIRAGVNFPLIEWCSALGMDYESSNTKRDIVWYDTAKDSLCYLRRVWAKKNLLPDGGVPVFPFFDVTDIMPFNAILIKKINARLKWTLTSQ